MIKVTEAELYQIIGELYVSRALTDQALKQQMTQVSEMSKVITRLRAEAENGKLEQPDINNQLRRVSPGDEGQDSRRSDDVPERTD